MSDPSPTLPGAPPLYDKIYRAVNDPLTRYNRLRVAGLQNFPAEGGVILCPLHNGMLDAAFVSLAAGRKGRVVRWIGDDEIMNNPVFGPLLTQLGIISIAVHMGVSKDKEQVKAVLGETANLVKDGEVVGMFPEGLIRPFWKEKGTSEFKTGIIRMALATGAPIVPVWADGAEKIFPWVHSWSLNGTEVFLTVPLWLPTPVTVRFGPPFFVNRKKLGDHPTREALANEADRLRQAMHHLMGL